MNIVSKRKEKDVQQTGVPVNTVLELDVYVIDRSVARRSDVIKTFEVSSMVKVIPAVGCDKSVFLILLQNTASMIPSTVYSKYETD